MERKTFDEKSRALQNALNEFIGTDEVTLAPKAVTKVTSFKRWVMTFTKEHKPRQ